ncbi:3-oxoacyl- acyl-carrier-protein synthase [Nesidiocoris tenuis]|uniref:3-oxoacyl-[acyl-carrier-protein] synthase n=1 Tax=Nesidiocoris tenuis TaxID=355587 RepID=A0ABN7B3Z7_9HEMI|nr:3-oxoacyl- acyl-carrier-protein synthase [Nesidiocoris tenuis]
MNRRVVVTGFGLVSPLGHDVKSAWINLLAGKSGVTKLSGDDYQKLPCRIAATVKQGSKPDELNLLNHVSKSDLRTMSPGTVFALIAAEEALKDSGWQPVDANERQRSGVCVGMGMADLAIIAETYDALKQGYTKVSPYFVPRILPNMAAGQISMKYGLQGPNHTVSTACATGCHAIGDGFKFIKNDYADVMLCGGAEACISPLAIAGFCRLRALATSFNDDPTNGSRPFDARREGFVMGEGAAILVLEELNHAKERQAPIYGEILGYGLSGDASHITSPHQDGDGALLAMSCALRDAKLPASDVTYVNAHATSTPLGDGIELKAIARLLEGDTSRIAVSSTKGAHGHLLGAAGNLETLFTVLACYYGQMPPTLNLTDKCEEGKNVNLIPNLPQSWDKESRIALKNSFGFGGTNASLCIGNYKQ